MEETNLERAADSQRQFVPLKLGKETFSLVYDYDAVVKTEEMADMELLFGVDWSRITARRMRAMLCALMLTAHPNMKPEHLSKYITHRNLPKIQAALIAAWKGSEPDDTEDE